MKTAVYVCSAGLLFSPGLYGQISTDSVRQIPGVTITGYLEPRSLLNVPSSASFIGLRDLRRQHGFSFVPAFNTVSGVRMEERSPGSYRFSIRGSLLRSPFGVRNVKIYIDDIPLTDAGGNSYLNSLDPGSMQGIEVLKGPDGSLFGANSGGVLILKPSTMHDDSAGWIASLKGGAWLQVHQQLQGHKTGKKHRTAFAQSYQQAAGYREHSALRRIYGHLNHTWNYSPAGSLKLFSFFSDLQYETPGGLTLTEFHAEPRAARPATAFLPGAAEQQSGVFNRTGLGGITHEFLVLPGIRHVIAVFGSATDFKNPFITNFEQRYEQTAGMRTYVEWKERGPTLLRWKLYAGGELQQTRNDIRNFGNKSGEKDTLQSQDNVRAHQFFYFSRFSATLFRNLIFEAAASVNYYRLLVEPAVITNPPGKLKLRPELMPRSAVLYPLAKHLSVRVSASRGYSPPTLAEIRSSNQVITTSLLAENGWNYEAGLRFRDSSGRITANLAVYRFRLQDAIVRRTDPAGNEFFINAGGTHQAGIETEMAAYIIFPRNTGLLRMCRMKSAFTYSDFRFRDYQQQHVNYSGNRVTGVPQYTAATSVDVLLPGNLYIYFQHFYIDRIPLNDANTEFANAYNLVQAKVGWLRFIGTRKQLELYAGVDNLLNQLYSLGNDLNAFGGRYYNAAPGRNFYAGLRTVF